MICYSVIPSGSSQAAGWAWGWRSSGSLAVKVSSWTRSGDMSSVSETHTHRHTQCDTLITVHNLSHQQLSAPGWSDWRLPRSPAGIPPPSRYHGDRLQWGVCPRCSSPARSGEMHLSSEGDTADGRPHHTPADTPAGRDEERREENTVSTTVHHRDKVKLRLKIKRKWNLVLGPRGHRAPLPPSVSWMLILTERDTPV